jgi:hypothetical protein
MLTLSVLTSAPFRPLLFTMTGASPRSHERAIEPWLLLVSQMPHLELLGPGQQPSLP